MVTSEVHGETIDGRHCSVHRSETSNNLPQKIHDTRQRNLLIALNPDHSAHYPLRMRNAGLYRSSHFTSAGQER